MDILVVEDDKPILDVIQQYFCFILQAEVCDSATTLDDALKMVRAKRYDLILLDWILGGVKSDSVVFESRKLYPDSPPRICLMSAMRGASKAATEIKVDMFLSKPYDLDSLDKFLSMNEKQNKESFLR